MGLEPCHDPPEPTVLWVVGQVYDESHNQTRNSVRSKVMIGPLNLRPKGLEARESPPQLSLVPTENKEGP